MYDSKIANGNFNTSLLISEQLDFDCLSDDIKSKLQFASTELNRIWEDFTF